MGCGCNGIETYEPRSRAVSAGGQDRADARLTDAMGAISRLFGNAPPVGTATEAGPSPGGFAAILAGIPKTAQSETDAPVAPPPPQGFPGSVAQLGRPVKSKGAGLFGALSAFNRSQVAKAAAAAPMLAPGGGPIGAPSGDSWVDRMRDLAKTQEAAPSGESWVDRMRDLAKPKAANGWSGELRGAVMEAHAQDVTRAKIREAALAAGQRELVVQKWDGTAWKAEQRFVSAAQFQTIQRLASLQPISVDTFDGWDPYVADAVVGDIVAQACLGWGKVWGRADPLPFHPGLPAAWRHLERRGIVAACANLTAQFRQLGSVYLTPPNWDMGPFYAEVGLKYVPLAD